MATLASAVLAWRVWLAWGFINTSRSDFSAYLGAAQQLAAGRTPWGEQAYLYPPLMAVLALPLTPLDYLTAQRSWFVVLVLCLLITAVLLGDLIGKRHGGVAAGLAILAGMGLIEENLVLGQPNPLILVLLAAALLMGRRHRSGAEGLLVGTAAALKLWPAVLAIVALRGRRFRAVMVATGVFILLGVLLTILARQLPGPKRPPRIDFLSGTPSFLNHSAAGLALRIAIPVPAGQELPRLWVEGGGALEAVELPPAARRWALAASALAGGWIAGWLSWALARRPSGPAAELLLAALVLTGTLTLLPVCWPHYLLVHALTLAALLAAARRGKWLPTVGALGLVLVATWSSRLLVGGYVNAWGFQATHRALLWAATSAALAAQLTLVPTLAVLLRHSNDCP